MTTEAIPAIPRVRSLAWLGWTLTTLVVLFLLMDSVMKLADMPFVRQASAQIGFPVSVDRTIGFIELVCLVLYAVPRTAVLGAILTTGLLGGAVAAHFLLGDPVFTHTLFGVYVGILAWGGLWFRDPRIRALIPLA